MVKSLKPLKHRIEYAGFRLAEALACAFSLETASALSGGLWRRFGRYSARHDRAMLHLASAMPEMSLEQREAVANDMWDMLGRTFIESFRLREIVEGERMILEDEEYWRQRSAAEGGWIVCSGHYGNWEAAAGALQKIGRPTAGVYQRLSNPLVDARARMLRAFLYPDGLFVKERGLAMRLFNKARNGTTLAVLADLRDRTGVETLFFGSPAPSSILPALLARNLNMPLLAGRVVRRPRVRFAASLVEIPVPHTEDTAADVRTATQSLQTQYEKWIRAEPGQWMWAHRRWG